MIQLNYKQEVCEWENIYYPNSLIFILTITLQLKRTYILHDQMIDTNVRPKWFEN